MSMAVASRYACHSVIGIVEYVLVCERPWTRRRSPAASRRACCGARSKDVMRTTPCLSGEKPLPSGPTAYREALSQRAPRDS